MRKTIVAITAAAVAVLGVTTATTASAAPSKKGQAVQTSLVNLSHYTLKATLKTRISGQPLAGELVTFTTLTSVFGNKSYTLCSGYTNNYGVASCNPGGYGYWVLYYYGEGQYTASFSGDKPYAATLADGQLY